MSHLNTDPWILDYGVGALLAFAPGSSVRGGAETWVPVILSLAAIDYSLFTDYELGVVRAISMTTHLGLDAGSSVILSPSPGSSAAPIWSTSGP